MDLCRNYFLIFFLLIFLSQTTTAQYSGEEEYLMAGDAVRIQIWDLRKESKGTNPTSNLNDEYVIDNDGNIYLPFLGFLKVAGKTPLEVSSLIKENYAGYLQDPYIYVRPLIRLTVMGQVERPGAYRVDPKSSLWELLSIAGGPTDNADLEKMAVIRGGEKEIENLLTAFEKAYTLSEVGVQSGDQIAVPTERHFSIQSVINYLNFAATLAWIYIRVTDRL